MTTAILVFNAGSSSLKFAVWSVDGEPSVCLQGLVEGLGGQPHLQAHDALGQSIFSHAWPEGTKLSHDEALAMVWDRLQAALPGLSVIGVGHRVVHGGTQFQSPVMVDDQVMQSLQALVNLAPLHQPHNLSAIEAVRRMLPGVTQVACFDTAFHATQPDVAKRFALPRAWHDKGVQRYGFHGLSYEYIAQYLPRMDTLAANGKTVVLHLGNGASMCALQAGRSQACSMGFTALDGLMMGTRCGQMDPGVVLWLLDQQKLSVAEVERMLYKDSGLLGVSGLAADMRVLLGSDHPHAKEALELFVYRITTALGAMAAALGGLDAIVFTAGIGEHAAPVREAVCRQMAWLGVSLDPDANQGASALREGEHRRITTQGSAISAWVVPTDEERMIALHTWTLVKSPPALQ